MTDYALYREKMGIGIFLAFFPFLVDIGYGGGDEAAFPFCTPQKIVIFHCFRRLSPILCTVFLVGGGFSEIFAQFDARNPQNRSVRDVRGTPSANPAAAMMRDMQASLQKLPWNDLSPAVQTKIKSVTSGASLFHRMPQQTVYADPEIYHFLIRHPDLVIGFWEQLGATQLSLREIRENRYVLKETTDSTATIDILYRANDICIAYAKGEYRGPLLARSYQGEVVLVLRTQLTRDEANEPMVVCDLEAFIQINSLGADVLAKLFFSSLTKVADSNFEITASFVSQVSKAAYRNTSALVATVEEISSVRPEVCDEFCEVVDRAAVRFARRNQPIPLETAQQRSLATEQAPTERVHTEQARTSRQDFPISLKPPSDWGMDHFFDTPQLPYTAVRYEREGELSIPKPLGSGAAEHVIPALPKQAK